MFQPGQSGNPGGRKKGSRNSDALIRDALRESFAQLGGVDFLVALATKDPRTYARLLARDITARTEDETRRGLAGEMRALEDMSETELRQLAYTVDAQVIEVDEVEQDMPAAALVAPADTAAARPRDLSEEPAAHC